ncbi:MAG: hypothetical protein QF794_08190, partial [Candidatus Marinimicrobia bacterium]|nr:hypothetical protein [Candidatus Neomarinimicrobiota bacterium]
MKLTDKQINDFKWVLENIGNLDWNDPDSEVYDEPYLMIHGWLGGSDLDYIKSELRADLEDAISSGEANDVDGKLALDLIV